MSIESRSLTRIWISRVERQEIERMARREALVLFGLALIVVALAAAVFAL